MRSLVALSILFATSQLSSALSVATEMIVSVSDQQLALIDRGKLISKYPISTSKFGLGDGSGSYRTPLGVLFVSAKFGDRLPAGAVIKNRVPTGEILNPNAPGRDAIVSTSRSAISMNVVAIALDGAACTTGVPLSPHSRTVGSIGTCPSSGAFANSAIA